MVQLFFIVSLTPRLLLLLLLFHLISFHSNAASLVLRTVDRAILDKEEEEEEEADLGEVVKEASK